MSPLAHDDDEDDDCKNSKYLRQSQGTPGRYRIWTCGYRNSFMTISIHGGLDDDQHHGGHDDDHHHGGLDDDRHHGDSDASIGFPPYPHGNSSQVYIVHAFKIISFEDNEENQWK